VNTSVVCHFQKEVLKASASFTIFSSPTDFRKHLSRRTCNYPGFLSDHGEHSPCQTIFIMDTNEKKTYIVSKCWDLGGCWLTQTNLAYPHWYIWNEQWLLPVHKNRLEFLFQYLRSSVIWPPFIPQISLQPLLRYYYLLPSGAQLFWKLNLNISLLLVIRLTITA